LCNILLDKISGVCYNGKFWWLRAASHQPSAFSGKTHKKVLFSTKNFVNSDEFFIFYAILPIKSTFSVLSLAIF